MNKKSKIFSTITLVLAFLLVFFVCVEAGTIKDFIKANKYSPTPELSDIESSLGLTPYASRVFRASAPVLAKDYDIIVENCYDEESDEDASIRGCFHDGTIYAFDIDAPELAGVVESTFAHELLHAVWVRLPYHRQAVLSEAMKPLYEDDDELKKELSIYPKEQLDTELFARLGTERASLSSELESAYAEVFSDRSDILDFYDSYSSVFKELSKKLKSLESELAEKNSEIEKLNSEYEKRLASYNSAVDAFNICAATPDCFDWSTYDSEKSSLESERAELVEIYEKLNQKIIFYNKKVEEYNSNVIKGKKLNSLANPQKEERKL